MVLANEQFFILPRRISSDLHESHSSKVRLALQHGRMDHKGSFAACAIVNLSKETKAQGRSMKKRNAGGSLVEVSDKNFKDECELCTKFTKFKEKSCSNKNIDFREKEPYRWIQVNGLDCLQSFYDREFVTNFMMQEKTLYNGSPLDLYERFVNK